MKRNADIGLFTKPAIIVCSPCAKARQISESELVDGARLGTGAELIELACNSAVISL